MKKYSQIIFDSGISKKTSLDDLKVTYKITEDELDLVVKVYQAYKIKKLTAAPSIEVFMKELVFSNINTFQEKCKYSEIYSDKNEEK